MDVLEISAIHEAAHAVVKWRLGCECYGVVGDAGFDHIAIRTEAEMTAGLHRDTQGQARNCSGIFESNPFRKGVGPFSPGDPDWVVARERERMNHDIMVMLAGPIAEARVRSCAVETLFERPEGGFQDHQDATRTVEQMNLPAAEFQPRLADLQRRAMAYVEDPHIWSVIEALARALLTRSDRRLTGQDALPILECGWQASLKSTLETDK